MGTMAVKKKKTVKKRTKKRKNKHGLGALIFAAVLVLFAYLELYLTFQDQRILNDCYLQVHFIDVGQGDSIFIQAGKETMLIDTGENNGNAYDYLLSLDIERLDYAVATHPHSDHIGAMSRIIDTFDIGTFLMPNAVHNTVTFENMISSLENSSAEVIEAMGGTAFYLGDALIEVFAPNSHSYDNLNNYSVVLKLTYEEYSFLFTGDGEYLSETEMLAQDYNLNSWVLKTGHHGSNTSSSMEFLEAVSPEYAVISLGSGNKYGHPHKEVSQRFIELGTAVYRTDLSGTIIFGIDSTGNYHIFEKGGES